MKTQLRKYICYLKSLGLSSTIISKHIFNEEYSSQTIKTIKKEFSNVKPLIYAKGYYYTEPVVSRRLKFSSNIKFFLQGSSLIIINQKDNFIVKNLQEKDDSNILKICKTNEVFINSWDFSNLKVYTESNFKYYADPNIDESFLLFIPENTFLSKYKVNS